MSCFFVAPSCFFAAGPWISPDVPSLSVPLGSFFCCFAAGPRISPDAPSLSFSLASMSCFFVAPSCFFAAGPWISPDVPSLSVPLWSFFCCFVAGPRISPDAPSAAVVSFSFFFACLTMSAILLPFVCGLVLCHSAHIAFAFWTSSGISRAAAANSVGNEIAIQPKTFGINRGITATS